MMKAATAMLFFLALGACAYTPTAPTPYLAPAPRVATQLVIRIAGPSGWWPDRIYAVATAYDRAGAEVGAVVTCQSTQGVWEPATFDTATRVGVLVRGIQPGATLSCHAGSVTASYTVTAGDWRLFCCGAPTPAPKPPVVPVPDSGGA